MEKITGFLLIFIILFLAYSYFSLKKEQSKNKKKEIKKSSENKEEENYEKHAIAAVIATLMDGKKYKIRNIFLEKEKNKENNKSAWKIAGRSYNMQRRDRI